MAGRPLPWTDLMEALGEERFEQLKTALAESSLDARDRDAFLLDGAAGALLRELVPEDAPAESVTAYGALLHTFYLCWSAGWPTKTTDTDSLRSALAKPVLPTPDTPHPTPLYIQLPERLVWAEPARGSPHEPLDGVFVTVEPGRVRALAVLGFRPGRQGFTTIEAAAPLPLAPPPPRPDGGPAFAPALPGGDRAGLFSLTDQHELLALALLAAGR